jgi:hypothetical protein
MRKAHGQHNLDLCNMLLADGEYNDWVVTTAFYSAVHFVEHALFPLIENGIEYTDFNEYWQNKPLQESSKHTCKKNLVRVYLTSVSTKYRELLDDCHNYRYNDYNVSDYNAKASKDKADLIKRACLSKKP